MVCLRTMICMECMNEFFGSTERKLCNRCYDLIELRKENEKLKKAKEILKKMIKRLKKEK